MRPARYAAFVCVAALALSGCAQQSPAVAAYIGDVTFTQRSVDAIFDDARTAFEADQAKLVTGTAAAPGEQLERPSLPITRRHVVDLLLTLDLGHRVADARGLTPTRPEVPAELIESVLGVPAETRYVALYQEWYRLYDTLQDEVAPAEVTDDRMMTVYDALVDAHAIDPGLSAPVVREQFGGGEFAALPLTVSDLLRDEAEKAGTVVNPKYLPVAVPMIASANNQSFPYRMPYLQAGTVVTTS
ncbi:hypothetical protein J2S43_007808 [Catenuloplanes nepalensis]|uniref:Uncharacterized protein n=1 Tax=Catenuloplanes nepalensis TaxID=587533 RepID=A0ABT9N7R4_9ACTN|nr:hypothetical protein [Catenuloplanes nepalensis]MDP9799296.1 hypothetical protein [Catenuloplanes nepalensis]